MISKRERPRVQRKSWGTARALQELREQCTAGGTGECHCLHFPCMWIMDGSSTQVLWPTCRALECIPRHPSCRSYIQQKHEGTIACMQGAAAPMDWSSRYSWVLLCTPTRLHMHTGLSHLESMELPNAMAPTCRATLSKEIMQIVGCYCILTWGCPPGETVELAKHCGKHAGLPHAEKV